MVTAPAPLFTVIPPVPSVMERVVLFSLRSVLAKVLLKLSDKALLAPFNVMICAMALADVMLKITSSFAAGSAVGLGVAALAAVDQFAAVAHEAEADAPSQ
jgi:hypothetical protein